MDITIVPPSNMAVFYYQMFLAMGFNVVTIIGGADIWREGNRVIGGAAIGLGFFMSLVVAFWVVTNIIIKG